MVKLDLIFISICIGYACADIDNYEMVTSFTTTRPISGYLSRSSQHSSLRCSRACSRSTQCSSFFYTDDDMDCQLHADVLDPVTFTGKTEAVTKTLYYVPRIFAQPSTTTTQTPTTTTQTPTTTTQTPTTTDQTSTASTPFQFDCNSIFSEWTEARLSNGTTFHVRIVHNNTIHKEIATDVCSSQNSSDLPKIITVEKLDYYRTVILQCPDVAGKSYWVDGSNTVTDDWIWRTSDEVAIPLSQGEGGLWISGRPNGGDNPNCLWMWESYESRFDDTECDKSDVHVICEME